MEEYRAEFTKLVDIKKKNQEMKKENEQFEQSLDDEVDALKEELMQLE